MRAHVLRCNLQGEALKLVESCDDDYDEMIGRLKQEFGDPRKVTEVILSSLRVKPLKDDNTKGFIEYVDLLEKADEKLRKLGLLHEISNSQVLGDIERRLPPKVRNEWAKLICEKEGSDLSQPYQFLISFLKDQRKQVKYLTSIIRAPPPSTTASSSFHFQGLQMEDGGEKKGKEHIICYNCGNEGHVAKNCDCVVEYFSCACCKSNDHPNTNCDVFKGFKPKERHAAIKSIKACFLCFGAHRTTACPRKDRKCGVCGKSNHNDLLCFKSESTSNGHCESSKPPETTKDGYETSAGTNENTMLHIMKVAGAEKNTSLNVFFDDGSKGNFITHDAAKRHNCPSENITVDVTLLNNVVETLETVKYRVGIRERNGKIRYIYAYGTDKVTGDISQVDMKIISQIFPDLTQAQLKNLERPSGAVDLLIGNFYSAWQPTRTLGKGHLSIMSNCFGRCISGSHPKLSIGSSERRICPDVFNERTTAQRVGVSTHTQLISTSHTPNQNMDSNVSSNQLSWPTCGGCQCGRGCYGGWDQERGEVHTQAHATSIRHQQPSLQHSERDSFFRAEN